MNIDTEKLQNILDEAVDRGDECGLQLTLFLRGEMIAELCAGYSDRARTKAVTPETLFPVYSCGKGVMSAAFHILAERGIIGYDDRISDYWPEYGCSGKEDTLVWHALTHRAGVHILPHTDSPAELGEWDLMCRRLASARPLQIPGGRCQYHAITFAWLIGELIYRASGIHLKDLITQEILKPLELEKKLFFGTDAEIEKNLAEVDGPEDCWCRTFMEEPAVRRGFIPSANGVGTATALAKIYAAVIGKCGGVNLLQKETVRNAAILRRHKDDPIPPGGTWAKFGLGWALPCSPENEDIFGHGGALGGEAFADLEHQLAVGFVKNHFTPTHPLHPVRDRISEALGLPLRHW